MSKLSGAVIAAGAAIVLLCGCSAATNASTAPAATASSTTAAAIAAPTVEAAPSATSRPVVVKAAPRPKNFCAANTAAQHVIVSIRKQHAWMCARRRSVYDTAVTTGMTGQWTATPTGNYRIQGRNRDTVLTLDTGARYDVRYWIPFDAPLYGFHDSSWQHFPYGSARYRTHGSHGCIHMPLTAMKFLYRWSARPTSVRIS